MRDPVVAAGECSCQPHPRTAMSCCPQRPGPPQALPPQPRAQQGTARPLPGSPGSVCGAGSTRGATAGSCSPREPFLLQEGQLGRRIPRMPGCLLPSSLHLQHGTSVPQHPARGCRAASAAESQRSQGRSQRDTSECAQLARTHKFGSWDPAEPSERKGQKTEWEEEQRHPTGRPWVRAGCSADTGHSLRDPGQGTPAQLRDEEGQPAGQRSTLLWPQQHNRDKESGTARGTVTSAAETGLQLPPGTSETL